MTHRPGDEAYALIERLYPICRSITGNGVRQTLAILGEHIPIDVTEVPSGTKVLDWVVPDEWNIEDAYLADPSGRRLVDFRRSNLHIVNYSEPVRARMSLEELRPRLHTLPDRPELVPYRTSYYERTWGFCLSARALDSVGAGPFDVVVDTTLEPGELTYGELAIPGETDDEVLFTTHVCHPSIANDNLSGIVVAIELARALAALPGRRFSYRFVFAPGTIGSITWLSRNRRLLDHIRHGLVLTGLGGPGRLVYQRTRRGDRAIDRAAAPPVTRRGGEVRDYSPYGYDERQFNAIGFDLPVGRLSRTPHGEYPEYHTSADDLGFVRDEELLEAYAALLQVVEVLEHDAAYVNLSPHGEPQLGKRGLYPTTGGKSASDAVMAMLWTLGYSDGRATLLDIADRADLDFAQVCRAAADLTRAGLLERARGGPGSSVS